MHNTFNFIPSDDKPLESDRPGLESTFCPFTAYGQGQLLDISKFHALVYRVGMKSSGLNKILVVAMRNWAEHLAQGRVSNVSSMSCFCSANTGLSSIHTSQPFQPHVYVFPVLSVCSFFPPLHCIYFLGQLIYS